MLEELLDMMAKEIDLLPDDEIKDNLLIQLAELADNTQELRLKALFDSIMFEAKRLNV